MIQCRDECGEMQQNIFPDEWTRLPEMLWGPQLPRGQSRIFAFLHQTCHFWSRGNAKGLLLHRRAGRPRPPCLGNKPKILFRGRNNLQKIKSQLASVKHAKRPAWFQSLLCTRENEAGARGVLIGLSFLYTRAVYTVPVHRWLGNCENQVGFFSREVTLRGPTIGNNERMAYQKKVFLSPMN